jgi:hypothetical protein
VTFSTMEMVTVVENGGLVWGTSYHWRRWIDREGVCVGFEEGEGDSWEDRGIYWQVTRRIEWSCGVRTKVSCC